MKQRRSQGGETEKQRAGIQTDRRRCGQADEQTDK